MPLDPSSFLPRCGHCKKLAPELEQLATSLKGIAKVGGVNCDDEEVLCGQNGVSGYPTIHLVIKGEHTPYNGERSEKAIKKFVLDRVPTEVYNLRRKEQVTELLSTDKCKGIGGKSKGSKRSEYWGACAILHTEKFETSVMYKSLSVQLNDYMTLAEARGGNTQLARVSCVCHWQTYHHT